MTNPLQGFIIAALFMGIRNPTFAQFVSQFTSITMVYLSLSKALMPPGVLSNKDMSMFSKIKNILWTGIITSTAGTIFNGIIFNIAFFLRMCPALPALNQKVGLLLTITGLVFFLLVIIFVYKSKNVKLNFVVLSVFSLWGLLTGPFVFYVLFLPYWSHIGNGGVVMSNMLFYTDLSKTILFAHAAFTVTKLRDILSFDKLTSKSGIFMNFYFHFKLIMPLISLVILIMSSSTIYYN